MHRRPASESPTDVPLRFAFALLLASLSGVLTVLPMLVEPLWPLAWIGLAPAVRRLARRLSRKGLRSRLVDGDADVWAGDLLARQHHG